MPFQIYAKNFSRSEASENFVRSLVLYGEELLASRPIPQVEDHPLSARRVSLFNATRRAVVTGTNLMWISDLEHAV
jgi:hypothetical protein